MQNTPNPDVNSPITDNDSDSNSDIEQVNDNETENQEIPVPPDRQPNASIEEPPDTRKPPIGEKNNEPKQLV